MSTEVDRLVVVYDANLQRIEEKINKLVRSNYAAAAKVEKAWAGSGLKAGFNDLSKAAVSAASDIPGVGAALGKLGPAGIAAAAGIGAMIGAFAQAKAAVEFADEIGDTADRLHVTTDALQEYRIAIRSAGGESKGADEALEGFSETLGKAHEGLAKSVQAFHAVGIEPAQIATFKSADEALSAVVKAMEGLSDAEKDAVIQQFGLGGLKQLIDGGTDAYEKHMAAAREAGSVMDTELIKRGGELKDQIDEVNTIISVQLKSAFIQLGPVIVTLLGLMAQFAIAAADIVDSFRSIENKRKRGLEETQRGARSTITELGARTLSGHGLNPYEKWALKVANEELDETNKKLDEIYDAEKKAAALPSTKALAGKPGGTTKTKAGTKITAIDDAMTAAQMAAQQALFDELAFWKEIEKRANEAVSPFSTGSDFASTAAWQKGLADAAQAVQDDLHDSTYDGIRGGLEAGFRDGLPGVLHYLEDALLRSVLDSVADGLTHAVIGSKGGSSGFLAALASIFGRGYASGTMSSRSGVALVGERGPELVSLPGNSRVLSNTALNNVGMLGRSASGATIIFDNRGAMIWEQAARQMMSYADRAAAGASGVAVQVSRRATPDDMDRRAGRRLG